MSSFWSCLQEFPPYYVRLLAKNGPMTALSDAEIAIASGIDINRVRAINMMTDWQQVTIGEMMRYTLACNFDPTRSADRTRAHDYEYRCSKRNTTPFTYLKNSPKWESEILPVLMILQRKLTRGSSAA